MECKSRVLIRSCDIEIWTWWTFRIFLFFLLGGGEGGSEAPGRGRGSVLFIESTRRGGGGLPGGGGGGEGAGGCLWQIWGGGG